MCVLACMQQIALEKSDLLPCTGVGILTFETVGKVPRNYSGRLMTHPIAIANAAAAGLGAQVLQGCFFAI
jgi:hypothetical protein